MKKIAVQNLCMIITEQCNLKCEHCLRGQCSNRVMSDEVIEATLDQICSIVNLNICGGEPTFALDRLEKIIDVIVEKQILVDAISVVINGTRYDGKFLDLLKYFDDEAFSAHKKKVIFSISWDEYHHREIDRLNMRKKYIENVKRYMESKYFYELNGIHGKLYREGNAELLDESLTIPYVPMKNIITYARNSWGKEDRVNGLCNIGPMVSINTQGIITDCNASYEHQDTIYNYGNVLNESIEEVLLRDCIIVKPRKFYKALGKEIRDYYNR